MYSLSRAAAEHDGLIGRLTDDLPSHLVQSLALHGRAVGRTLSDCDEGSRIGLLSDASAALVAGWGVESSLATSHVAGSRSAQDLDADVGRDTVSGLA